MLKVALAVKEIHKSFDSAPLLRGVSLEIARGEIACLLGPSGSGKTTLLRIIAGLEQAESGAVLFDGQEMRAVPVHQRGFGLMFQDLALFPHRDVFQNIAFGLKMQNHSPAEIERRVRELLELVGLKTLATRDVNQLSGGEQQRVALARALAPQPRLLMFDEPLGALDLILREQLAGDLRTILKKLDMTALYVTHDQNEAFAVADRVFIIHAGKIAQSGTPREVYETPASAFVARFLGMENLVPGRLTGVSRAGARVETDAGVFVISAEEANVTPGTKDVWVLIRPDAAEKIAPKTGGEKGDWIEGRVVESRYLPGNTRVRIKTRGGALVSFDWRAAVETRTRVRVKLKRDRLILLYE